MDAPISKFLKTTFLVHMIVALILGAVLLLIPGRALLFLRWVPAQVQLPECATGVSGQAFLDTVFTRVLGAALLALAYTSYVGWRASRREQVNLLVQMEFLFCVLGTIGFLLGRISMGRPMPTVGWLFTALTLAFAVVWGIALRR